jgi:hypothetical protein
MVLFLFHTYIIKKTTQLLSLPLRISLLFKKYKSLCYTLALTVLVLSLSSCNVVKRLKSDQHLVTKNTIIEDEKINNEERINNIIVQKANTGMKGFLGVKLPLKLGIYNLARPNIDSIIKANVLNDSSKVKRKISLLSKKQFDKEIQSRKSFNSWLKRTGEAPTIFNEEKTIKTANNLRKYYYSKGWFNNQVDYQVEKDSNKRAKVTYKVTKRNLINSILLNRLLVVLQLTLFT